MAAFSPGHRNIADLRRCVIYCRAERDSWWRVLAGRGVVLFACCLVEHGSFGKISISQPLMCKAKSAEFPVANWGGWSSVLHDGDLRKYDDALQDVDDDEFSLSAPDETPKVGELGTATDLNGHTSTGRVTQFYRMLTEEDEIAAYGEESAAGIKELEGILNESLALPTDPAKGPVKLIPCTRDEAQFVSCSGIAGFVAPVSSFASQRLAKWDKRTIMKDRLDVERQAKQHMRLRIKRVVTIDISRFY